MEDLEQFQFDVKFVIKTSRHSAEIFRQVQDLEIKWYHAFYDKKLKQLQDDFTLGYEDFMAIQKRFQFDIKAKANPMLEHQQQIKFGMLTVSGHLYAETGRMLQICRQKALIKCGLAINTIAVAVFVVDIIYKSF